MDGIDKIQFLLIQRKDSLAFVEFIRGKYAPSEHEYVIQLIRGMTKNEHMKLMTMTFDELWRSVWGDASKSHKTDYDNSERKYRFLQQNGLIDIILQNQTQWTEPEWGFPKGRRNPHESDIACAVREFQEETNLHKGQFSILQNTNAISETFFGSNQIHYCHKYYLAICHPSVSVSLIQANPHMSREIGAIEWLTLEQALAKIRPDNVEKREILLKAGRILRNFCPVNTWDTRKSGGEKRSH